MVFEATYIAETKASCLYHVHSNFATSNTSGSIAAEIADQLHVFSLVYDPHYSPIPDAMDVRDSKKFDAISFPNALKNANWLPV